MFCRLPVLTATTRSGCIGMAFFDGMSHSSGKKCYANACKARLLIHIIRLLAQIHEELAGETEEQLKRRLDNKVHEKDEYIDG